MTIKPYDSSDLDQEVIDGLRKAFRKIRPIYPIVVAGDGEILDGRHRMTAAPGTYQTYKVTMKEVVSNKDKLLWKLHLNYRRQVTTQERKKQVTELAEILAKEGVKREDMVSTIADTTPLSMRYVRELLPEEYKMTERAHKYEEPVPHIPEAPQVYTPKPTPKPETGAVKVIGEPFKETWEYRKSQMSQPISKMDIAVADELQSKGVRIETQKEFCLSTTIPDVYAVDKNVAIFLDGPVHVGREDRDETLRDLLRKRHGVKVLSISYKTYSEAERARIVQIILEYLNIT